MTTVRLCAIDDLSDPGSAGFALDVEDSPVSIMVVRFDGNIYLYLNTCPHVGVPLDLGQGWFLDRSSTHIQCSYHGALFHIDDGKCIFGPCTGKSLTPIPFHLDGPDVVVKTDTLIELNLFS